MQTSTKWQETVEEENVFYKFYLFCSRTLVHAIWN